MEIMESMSLLVSKVAQEYKGLEWQVSPLEFAEGILNNGEMPTDQKEVEKLFLDNILLFCNSDFTFAGEQTARFI